MEISKSDKVCQHCDKKHDRKNMCVKAMRSFIDRTDRTKKVKPFSAKNLSKASVRTFFQRKKKTRRQNSLASTKVIDLTSSPPPMEPIERPHSPTTSADTSQVSDTETSRQGKGLNPKI